MKIVGDMLKRDIGYFSDDPTDSRMEVIDEDTIVFWSAYSGMEFREEIRLLNGDITDCVKQWATRKASRSLLGSTSKRRHKRCLLDEA